jgi:hypothetical protein
MDCRIDVNFDLLLKIDINFDIKFQEYHLLIGFVINLGRPLSVVLGFYHRTDDGPPRHPRQSVSRSLRSLTLRHPTPAQHLMYLIH